MTAPKTLLSAEKIAAKVRELGAEITQDYQGKSPLLVGVLKGCVTFMADLARAIDLPCEFEFMKVSSYGAGTKTSGTVKILMDLGCDIEGRDIIIIEDILDSGLTLDYLIKQLQIRKPASIKICTLLEKPSRRQTDVVVDYLGFQVEDLFVVGYGLDYAGLYRNLSYIGILEN
ncbi:MAG: hypoxanthine phosphoribosyltransferase [Oscillospiraceae bacterium]|nr:hypoxanthine phosphoribosyltransferase [Oscillospiraceae bacterium]